jgi:hypothetical protein
MTPVPRFVGTAALLLASALPAPAGPCSGAFDGLRDEVEVRRALVADPATPAEKAERKALDRVLRRLRRRSRSLARDASTARVAGEALAALYPGDGGIAALVDGALDGLRSDLALERDDLALTAGQLPAGPGRDRALEGLAEADAALAGTDGAADDDLPGRTGGLAAASAAVDAAFRAVLVGPDRRRRPCGERVTVREGGVLLWRADRVTVLHQASSGLLQVSARRARRPADDSEMLLEVSDFHGVGNYPLPFGSGTWRDGPFTYYGFVESGTLVVTAYDSQAGVCEGTFSLTARGCLFDCAATEVTGGAFATRRLRRL